MEAEIKRRRKRKIRRTMKRRIETKMSRGGPRSRKTKKERRGIT
jgi:hypothetical protein